VPGVPVGGKKAASKVPGAARPGEAEREKFRRGTMMRKGGKPVAIGT